jgi:hypothetical protein
MCLFCGVDCNAHTRLFCVVQHSLRQPGTVGIVAIATAIVIYASKNAVNGPVPFGGPKDEQEAPVTLTAAKAAMFPVIGSLMLLLL